jgi:hypothetical protein
MAVDLSDADLIARMRNFEDHFVERKTSNDTKDILKTIVAFANSAPLSLPAVLYLGVRDSGEMESPQVNLDGLQKAVNREMQKAYPRIPYLQRVLPFEGRQALAVIVYGSENRPHFAGPSYIRNGSESLAASEQQFSELIARRNSKVSKILEFKGKQVSLFVLSIIGGVSRHVPLGDFVTVHYCDQFYVTLALTREPSSERRSFPLEQVLITYDDSNDRLLLKIVG